MDVVQLLLHVTLFLWSMSSAILAVSSEAVPLLAKPNCQSRCGDIEIPYPFGIGEGCYIDDWFQIACVNSTKPFLNRINVEVLEISVKGTLKVTNPIIFSSNCSNKPIRQGANLEGSPFVFSQKNIFTAMGCGVMAVITSNSNGSTVSAGCKSECDNTSKNKKKNGVDFCQAPIPWSFSAFDTSFQVYDDHYTRSTSSCNYAFLIDHDWFKWFSNNSTNNFSAITHMDHVPVMLEWNLYHSTIDVFGAIVEVNTSAVSWESPFYCQSHNDSSNESSIRLECFCNGGNPDLLQGCQDKNECEVGNHCPAGSVCKNHFGHYQCYSPHSKSWLKMLFIVVLGYRFYSLVHGGRLQKVISIKLKEKFFKQNDGLSLELHYLSSSEADAFEN